MVSGLIIAFLAITAVLTQRTPDNALILLAEEDGSVGAVVYTSGAESVTLKDAQTGLDLDGTLAATKVRTFSDREIDGLFAQALAATPPAAKSYLLHFRTGASDVAQEVAPILQSILEEVARRDYAKVDVIGHTDRTGSANRNMILAERRARAVRDALVAGGVPADIISVRSHGEGDPLVPTADGVANDANRRVEVMIR